MNYYKMINNNQFVGAISSANFIFYVPGCGYMRTDENYGELVEYEGSYYRTPWMAPLKEESHSYITVSMLPISEDEYNIYNHANESNIEIDTEEQEETEEEIQPINPIEQDSLEFVRTSKLREMSATCRHIIEAGFDLELRGEIHHFSLDTQDQLNLISLSAMAQTQQLIPYHADGEECIFYTNEEMNEIVESATAFKIYHTTYYNALKVYINSLKTIEEIATIEYGVEIPEEYKSDVLKALQA